MSSTSPESGVAGRTRIIAHRGASGYLPEHTAVAKAMAFGLGADFIEQDLVATADQQLVVLHDLYLDNVSNVAARFPGRRRDDGHFYVVDFTFDELRTVSLRERRVPDGEALQFPGRFPYDLPELRVSRFIDEIHLISGLNASTGRHVGLYPEIKDPVWYMREGIDLAGLVHQALSDAGDVISGPVLIQSFDTDTLRRMKQELATPLPLIQLLDREGALALLSEPAAARRISEYAVGVGLPFDTLIEFGPGQNRLQAAPLAALLGEAGLLVHPYTMRRDVAPPDGIDYFAALRFLIHELGVDGLFCDQPDDALRVRDYSEA